VTTHYRQKQLIREFFFTTKKQGNESIISVLKLICVSLDVIMGTKTLIHIPLHMFLQPNFKPGK